MDRQLPTIGQLERQLSQNIQKFYRQELEHLPQKVTCKFFGNHISIVIEDAITAVETTLVNKDNADKVAKNFSLAMDDVIKSKLKTTIEAVLAVKVDDILFGSNFETKRAGAIVILDRVPKMYNPKPLPKIRRSKKENEGNVNKTE